MAYIYIITNAINGKQYIGKTERNIDKRFAEHKSDCFKRLKEKRPLYSAMRKYGIENFTCSILIETSNPEQDEIRFIKEYDTYKNGYNATLGGDGSRYVNIDIETLISEYNESNLITITYLAKKYGHDVDTISNLLKNNGVKISLGQKSRCKKIIQINIETNEVIKYFESASEAAKELGMCNGSHIIKCAKGKRFSTGGFKWEYC